MAETDPDTGTVWDTGAHRAAEAGGFGPGPVLRLEITEHREGLFDGAWWPYSHRVAVELPRLVAGLSGHWDPVTRIGVDLQAWEALPTRLVMDGRVVRIDGYPVADDTALVTRGDHQLFSLLVVPPEADPEAALAAMARALDPGNTTSAGDLLRETGVRRTHGG
ncbi:DUF5994 family protein [Streptomyces sp. BBFR102]|uniref:DUF5994 family protein n=1 Tax=Streptomyces sp. BBFR102 TaxID=3448171 RepID=UPI003F529486